MPYYRCVRNLDELKTYIGDSKILAFDFETSPKEAYENEKGAALDPHKSEITGISVSVKKDTGIYMPLNHKNSTNASKKSEVLNWLKDKVFMNEKMIKIAHNLSFEAMFLYGLGIIIQPPCYDTIAASQLTLKSNTEFRGLKDSGLKTLVPELFSVELPSFESVTSGKSFKELNPDDFETIRYACADSDYALRLYYIFNSWFDRFLPRHRFICEEIESPTAIYVGIMKYNGLLMDETLMQLKKEESERKLAEIKESIAFMIGDINIGANASTASFKNYLYKDLGLPVLKTTAKFKDAADDEAMILLRDFCKENRPELVNLFELIQEYRKWGKIKSTYIDGYMKYINEVTGRIHPDLFPLGTDTGRFSSRNPNLQNCPRKDNDPIGVRNFIIAPEDNVLLSLDFSQIELRVGAYFCRDENMLETYSSGGDIHAKTTSVIYKIPFEEAVNKNVEKYKERRTIAKNCNFGVFFGLFANGLRKNLKFKAGLDTSLSECEEIIKNLKLGYPRLGEWQEEVKKRAEFRCYAETALGRRRYLEGIKSDDWGKKSFAQRCALNTPIQGTAADILKLSIARLLIGLPSRTWIKPLLQIHDELVFEVPKDKVDEAVLFIKNCMEEMPFEDFDLPIIAEATVGIRFGELKELEL